MRALYRKLLLIRLCEEAILKHYPEDGMKTPMHMSMGEEAIVAGVCHALAPHDLVIGSYRSHGLYLAKTGDTDAFFAELYGRGGGCADGRAGSMHLSSPERGMMMSSAIVGASIPVGVGLAFANRYLDNGRMSAVFFGDGATDEGAFWESVNFACLHRLPVLFICQDNELAVHTYKAQRRGFRSLPEALAGFELDIYQTDSTDAAQIHQLVAGAIRRHAASGRPMLLQAAYYRYLEHVGINEDFHQGYRARAEFTAWRQRDPIRLMHQRLQDQGVDTGELEHLEQTLREQIARSVARAQAAPLSPPSAGSTGVYQCGS